MTQHTRIQLFLLLCLVFSFQAIAQESSKSKSKDVVYEKPGEIAQVELKNVISLNSPNTDFSPAFFQNGLVFVSSKRVNGARDKKTNETFFELYFSPFDPNGDPTSAQAFSLEINSSRHEGPVTFSRDWKTMYFTRNNQEKGVQKPDHTGTVHLKIYEARKGTFDWMDVRELPFNSDNFSCMHPTLSADGNTLYFASDMPGGIGGFDLYVVEKTGTGWSTPKNLGSEVNTDKNEVFPFIHAGGELFFSTSGHNSMGGLDIFKAKKTENTWSVANLGKPFNSEQDDLGIIMNDDASHGFFASSRAGGYGKDDVYSFKISGGVKSVEQPQSRRLAVEVRDHRGNPVQGAAVRILRPQLNGYTSDNKDFYRLEILPVKDNSNELVMKLVRKDAEEIGPADGFSNAEGLVFSEFEPYTNYIVVANLPGQKATEAMFSLDKLDGNKITLRLPDTQNCQKVSGMVAHEQFGKRLENSTIRFTNKANGQQSTVLSDNNGEFSVCLPGNGTYLVSANHAGFKAENTTFEVTGENNFLELRMRPRPISTGSEFFGEMPIQEGARITINDIRYDFKKANLNESAARHMEGLLQLLLSYPSLEVELIAHTDAQGSAESNLKLAQERAENCKNYLVYRGIKAFRIQTKGAGESQILNHCKEGINCSEEEHAKNRRLEVVIRKFTN